MKKVTTIQPLFDYKNYFKSFFATTVNNSGYFSSGRISLYNGLQSLLLRNNNINHVLLPSFICGEIAAVFKELNIKTIYYQLDKDLNIDFDFIEKNLSNINHLLFIVNFFGFPSNWEKINSLKQKYNCFVIEDNAHSIFGKYNNIDFGKLGDISFNSLRKILPLLSGSELSINITPELNDIYKKRKPRLPSLDEIKYSLRSYKPKFFRRPKVTIDKEFELDLGNTAIDYISHKVLTTNIFDKAKITSARRNNYLFWKDFLSNYDLEFLELNISDLNICPYVFPCIASNSDIIRKWKEWGEINQINIIQWPKFPTSESHFLAENKLKNIICFPVNQEVMLSKIKLTAPHI